MKRPDARDITGIVALLLTGGSVDYRIEEVPGQFVQWRHVLRKQAKSAGIRVSVRRVFDEVIVYDPDATPTDRQLRAVASPTRLGVAGDHSTSDIESLARERRAGMHIVRTDSEEPP